MREQTQYESGMLGGATPAPGSEGRIVSLDQFRDYTVAGMLLVNFLGGYQAVPAILKHHSLYICRRTDTDGRERT